MVAGFKHQVQTHVFGHVCDRRLCVETVLLALMRQNLNGHRNACGLMPNG